MRAPVRDAKNTKNTKKHKKQTNTRTPRFRTHDVLTSSLIQKRAMVTICAHLKSGTKHHKSNHACKMNKKFFYYIHPNCIFCSLDGKL